MSLFALCPPSARDTAPGSFQASHPWKELSLRCLLPGADTCAVWMCGDTYGTCAEDLSLALYGFHVYVQHNGFLFRVIFVFFFSSSFRSDFVVRGSCHPHNYSKAGTQITWIVTAPSGIQRMAIRRGPLHLVLLMYLHSTR